MVSPEVAVVLAIALCIVLLVGWIAWSFRGGYNDW